MRDLSFFPQEATLACPLHDDLLVLLGAWEEVFRDIEGTPPVNPAAHLPVYDLPVFDCQMRRLPYRIPSSFPIVSLSIATSKRYPAST